MSEKINYPYCGETMNYWEYDDVIDTESSAGEYYEKANYCCPHCNECFTAYIYYTMQYQGCTVVGE